MPVSISRRVFMSRAMVFAASAPTALRGSAFLNAGPALRVGAVNLPATANDPRSMGLQLGLEEATHAAALFGGHVELVAVPAAPLGAHGLTAIIGDVDCARTLTMSTSANVAGIPFLNVGCPADDLRAACRHTTFHVTPSDAMYRDALSAAHVNGKAVAWDPSLHRFGADTLNGRFVARFNHPMTPDAWTAWLAMKILWESALRVQSSDPAKLIDHLVLDSTQFDGHKGLPLSFRSWDHQLRQPLYVVGGPKLIELPAANPSEPARALLDRFGVRAADSVCHPGAS